MIKANDIRTIKADLLKYEKLLSKENDIVNILKYRRLIREQQYKFMNVEMQLDNIDISLSKDIFIDKYINGLTGDQLEEKYMMARSSIYRMLGKARKAFESNRWRI